MFNYYIINVIAQGLGRCFTFGSNFLVFILIARFLGAEIFGQYSYILNYLGIIVIMADFGLMSILGKDIAQNKESPEIYWGNFLILRLFINVIVVLISIPIAYYIRKDLFLLLLISSLALPFLASRFFEPVFQVFQRPWDSTLSSLIYGFTHLLFVFMALKIDSKLIYFVSAYILANLFYAIFAFYLSFRSIRPKFKISKTTIRNILVLAVPLGISSIFITVSNRISILMLAWLKSDHAVGIFSAAYKFVEISSFLAAMATAPLIPIFSEKAKENIVYIRDISGSIFELIAIVFIPFGVICSALSQEIITFIYGIKLIQSAEAFRILIWVCIIIFYSLLTASIAISLGIVNFAYWLGAFSAFLSAVLNYLLIQRFDYLGSAWTVLICEIVLVGVTLIYVIRHLGNFFKFKTWIEVIGLNIFLYLFINEKLLGINIFIKSLLGLLLYTLCILRLNILRTHIFSFFKMVRQNN